MSLYALRQCDDGATTRHRCVLAYGHVGKHDCSNVLDRRDTDDEDAWRLNHVEG